MARRLWVIIVAALAVLAGPLQPTQAHAYSSSVAEAQRIMTRFGIPAGPVDGASGPQTSRGLCVFRYLTGLPVSRSSLDSATLSKLRDYDNRYGSLQQIPASRRDGQRTYLVAHETCQAMVYVEYSSARGGSYYKRVMPISTGITSHNTPNGNYWLGGTAKGWWCSTLYPQTCSDNKDTDGRFGYLRNHAGRPAGWGNMYNFRTFKSGGWGVHGSKSVPTYPASHGCVRVTVADSDWMYAYVGNNGPTYFSVIGQY